VLDSSLKFFGSLNIPKSKNREFHFFEKEFTIKELSVPIISKTSKN